MQSAEEVNGETVNSFFQKALADLRTDGVSRASESG